MRTRPLLAAAVLASCTGSTEPAEGNHSRRVQVRPPGYVAKTVVARDGRRFRINGAVTYRGKAAAGLLMNVRMVNAIFEDANRPEFDPAANTDELVARMPEYVSLGVLAFTVSLQGGYPGYEGARNTAFLPTGDLNATYLTRAAKVIERADALGAVIILTLYYQRQDQYLQDEQAIRAGIVNVVDWIRAQGYRNVILELVNEYNHRGLDHAVLRSDASVAGLIVPEQAHRLQRGCEDRRDRRRRRQLERQGGRLVRAHAGAAEPGLPLRLRGPCRRSGRLRPHRRVDTLTTIRYRTGAR
jgi:hypothetical protein